MPLPDQLRRLLSAPGPSGYEAPAAEVFRELARDVADEVTWDTVGSTVARVKGTGDGPLVAVIGHIDEIGVIVSHIDEHGFLRFRQVGGWDVAVLIGQRVRLAGREGPVTGVIARKPAHVLEDDEREKLPKTKALHIDIGARDAEEARRLVRVGDVGVLEGDPAEVLNGRVISRALDNRLGCWVALETARALKESGGAPGDFAAVAATQEELLPRMSGATTTAYALRPDVAVVVDVTWETRQPGVEIGEVAPAEFGMGAVISRGPQLHPTVSDALIDAAEEEGIPHVVEAVSRGTFTDADAVYLVREGIPTGLVSVPIRYLHSPVEMVQLSDVDAAVRLLTAFVRRLGTGTDFLR